MRNPQTGARKMTASIRLTEFSAADTSDRERLAHYVRAGQEALRRSPHCLRCETFSDVQDARKVIAVEAWSSEEARDVAARQIPVDVVRDAMALMQAPPLSRTFSGSIAELQGASERSGPFHLVVIIASVREERFGPVIARWAQAQLAADARFDVKIIDLADVELPRALPGDPADLADPDKRPPSARNTSLVLGAADAILVVTPEYNRGLPASLKHFIDWHLVEWQAKPVAAIGYGGLAGGIRAIEQLRLVLAELHATVLRDAVTFNAPWELFDEEGTLKQPDAAVRAMSVLLRRLAWWAGALREGRRAHAYMTGVSA
jgi:NAD(P)H-dependent FMN reductase/quinol monooxygenase YgiN